ncbi:MAG: RNB domain-containing ribonuclease, partial [Victivallaceae bacterium]
MEKKKKRRLHRIAERTKTRKASRKHSTAVVAARGIISITPGGFGFVKPYQTEESEEKIQDIFIPPHFLNSSMNGDEVDVALLEERAEDKRDDRGPAGRVVEIIKRAHETIVGELIAGHKVRPLNKRISQDIEVSGSLNGAKRGEWVEIKLLHHQDDSSGIKRGAIVDKMGVAGEIANDLDAVCKEFSLMSPYTAEQNEDAAKVEPQDIRREDFRKLFCATIDPHDAKDFDDAISIMPGKDENEVELGVHIADVAAWITCGSELDQEALKRGFTSYLPGRTLPMLPKVLTAKISLTPDGDSLAHSVIMTVHKQSGRILSSRRTHSFIQVKKRLTFGEVQSFIDTGDLCEGWDREFAGKIGELVELTRNMREYRRRNEKFLEMSIPEVRVVCDEKENRIIGIERKEQREADQLVEECMLAANTEVAKELIERAIPGMYRVHPTPDPEKIAEFSVMAEESFGIVPGDLTSRIACNEFLDSLPDDPRKPALLGAFLRSLPRAYYLENSELHFGLGKGRYSHFTSPIRRYPDLIVHQQLWSADCNRRLKSKKTMAQVAADCSQKEQNNDDAYYTASDRLKLRYLDQQLVDGKENLHEGIIAK